MRVISQDGTMDFPYENSVVFINPRDMSTVRIAAIGDNDDGMIAKYSTGKSALKAMEMLRNEFAEHGESGFFQFPQGDEIEV